MPAELAEHFPDLAEVATYHRLRSDEKTGEPTNHARNYIRPELAERIDLDDLARWPMTKVLRDVVGVRISRITDTVEARLADPETARLLEVPLLSPILHYTGITYDDGGPGPGRGPHPLPRRPLLLHGHPRRDVQAVRPVVRCRA